MKNPIFRCVALAAAFVAAASSATLAQAQTYPEKPIQLIVPQAAGGGSDTIGRFIADKLSANLGQAVVVENRPGAAGVLGAELVKRAPADGYTLLLGAIDTITAPMVNSAVTLDALKDFEPVTQLAKSPNVWVLSPSFEGKNMADLVRLAKEKPMGIDFASSGVGGMQHLGGELLNQMAGIQLAHVPYKGGPPGFADVIGGRVPSMLSGIQGALPQVKSGKVIAAAVTDTKRSKALPDVPTVAEALNLPGYEVMNWQALFFPAGTPKDRVERISSEVRKILSMPESREKLEALGYEPIGNTPDEFAAVMKSEHKKWADLIKTAGIKAN
ncbi:tripartite tricarboxylate transporter substrate binding protein [Parapusillimonas sp. SGNA-6]|jgi:tripartite-type tricarboxylate transporter receptor subunit TctC|nr:tripartite tricarboxylate transporter substrate binding protein [Parapusillimonas sp. SGNA-6]